MTLDEAIEHYEKKAEGYERQIKDEVWEPDSLSEHNCIKNAEECRQLAEWLRELKHLRNLVAYSIDFHCSIEKAEKKLQVAEDKIAYIESLNEEINADADSDLCTRAADVPDTNVGELISREEVLNLIDTAFESGAFDGRYAYENLIDAVQNLIHPLETDLISRQAAINALWKALYEYEDKTEKQFIESDELNVADWIEHRIFVQNMSDIDRQTILALPSARPETHEKRTKTHACDCISREQAIKQCGFGMTSLLIADNLRRLPPVEPERKPGKWIRGIKRNFLDTRVNSNVEMKKVIGKGYHTYINAQCSECHKITIHDDSIEYQYCPHCGAPMEVDR